MTRCSLGWEVRPLGELATFKAGRTPARARPELWAEGAVGTPWVSISDMEPYGVVQSTAERVSDLGLRESFGGQTVAAGTLLMSFKLTIGRIATLGVPACHNEAVAAIYPGPDVSQRYLGYFLSQVDYESLQDRQIMGHTLNREKIERIPVLVPPLDEQEGIADVLDAVRRTLDLNTCGTSVVSELRRAAMRELFARGLRGEVQRPSEIGPIPSSWELRRLDDLCDIRSGGTPSKSTPEYWNGDIPWVSGKDLKLPVLDDAIDHVSELGLASGSRLAPASAVLLLVRGMGLAKDLPVALISRPMAFNQDIKALVPKSSLGGDFIRSAIYAGKDRLLGRIVSSAHGTMTLNLDDVASMLIPIPPSDEAREIVSILDAIDARLALHRRKRASLEELFKSLLHKLITGEIRFADLNLDALDGPPATKGATS